MLQLNMLLTSCCVPPRAWSQPAVAHHQCLLDKRGSARAVAMMAVVSRGYLPLSLFQAICMSRLVHDGIEHGLAEHARLQRRTADVAVQPAARPLPQRDGSAVSPQRHHPGIRRCAQCPATTHSPTIPYIAQLADAVAYGRTHARHGCSSRMSMTTSPGAPMSLLWSSQAAGAQLCRVSCCGGGLKRSLCRQGAHNGVVKLWDVRKTADPFASIDAVGQAQVLQQSLMRNQGESCSGLRCTVG